MNISGKKNMFCDNVFHPTDILHIYQVCWAAVFHPKSYLRKVFSMLSNGSGMKATAELPSRAEKADPCYSVF